MSEQCHIALQFPFSARVDQILEETIRQYPTMPESNASFIDANDRMGRIANQYLEDLLHGRKKRPRPASVTHSMVEWTSPTFTWACSKRPNTNWGGAGRRV